MLSSSTRHTVGRDQKLLLLELKLTTTIGIPMATELSVILPPSGRGRATSCLSYTRPSSCYCPEGWQTLPSMSKSILLLYCGAGCGVAILQDHRVSFLDGVTDTTQHTTTHHNTTQHNTTQHSTPQHNTTPPNTAQLR